jgi:hypothetical protein
MSPKLETVVKCGYCKGVFENGDIIVVDVTTKKAFHTNWHEVDGD